MAGSKTNISVAKFTLPTIDMSVDNPQAVSFKDWANPTFTFKEIKNSDEIDMSPLK